MIPRALGPGSPRQHHFIPQWFLENFTEHDKIARIKRADLLRVVITVVKNIAVERDHYTVDLSGTGRTSLIEDGLAVIDGRAAGPVRRLVSTREIGLSDDERRDVLQWIATLWVRGPRWRRQQEAIADLALKTTIREAPDVSALKKLLSERLGRSVSFEEAEELRQKISIGSGVKFAPIGSEITMRMMERVHEYARDLQNFRWELVSNLDSQLFLADMPVMFQLDTRFGRAESRPRVIQLPLSPKVLLNLFPPGVASDSPKRYFEPWLQQLRFNIARWSFVEIYCAPSAVDEIREIGILGPLPPLIVSQGDALVEAIVVDGLDHSRWRSRHYRVGKFRAPMKDDIV